MSRRTYDSIFGAGMIEQNSGSIQKQLAQPGSSLQKYRSATVGKKGFFYLAAYELILIGTGSLPGRLGSVLRSFFYSMLCKNTGARFMVGRDCTMKRPYLISIGDNVSLGENVSLDVKRDGLGIEIMDNVTIGPGTIFSCPGGLISLGKGTRTGRYCRLGSLEGLTIGTGCIIGNYTYIVGAGHRYDSIDQPIIDQPLTCKGPTRIGDNVIIGDRVTVLDGVQIGDNVQVESGSLVTGDIPAESKVSGVPARLCS